MKFLKKAVSCVLAGVMSLAVLTACGSSGSSGSSFDVTKAYETFMQQLSAGKYYMETEVTSTYGTETSSYTEITATNGEMVYTKYIKGDYTYESWEDKEYDYDIDNDSKTIMAFPKDEEYAGTLSTWMDADEYASSTQKTGTKTVDGTEYPCVILTGTEKGITYEIACCFNNNGTLKYVVTEASTNSTMKIKIINFTTDVDDSYFVFPEGYTIDFWD